MAAVTVLPENWSYVDFDGGTIAALAATLMDEIGLDVPLRIEVDETTPFGRARVASVDPLVLDVESGAFENAKNLRKLSERAVSDVLGRLLFRAKDRLDASFGDPPPDEDLTLAEATAWDTYAVGRVGRLGYPVQRQRRLYHFRNRHGFTDVSDATFDRLWTAENLTWADIAATCTPPAA